eukprot:scaffold12108_cov97-Isochrysis_galbana.AAC.7
MSKGVKEIIRKDREELARKLKIECRPCGVAMPLPAIGETPALAGAALNAPASSWTPPVHRPCSLTRPASAWTG